VILSVDQAVPYAPSTASCLRLCRGSCTNGLTGLDLPAAIFDLKTPQRKCGSEALLIYWSVA